jgi:hypothetical protein
LSSFYVASGDSIAGAFGVLFLLGLSVSLIGSVGRGTAGMGLTGVTGPAGSFGLRLGFSSSIGGSTGVDSTGFLVFLARLGFELSSSFVILGSGSS